MFAVCVCFVCFPLQEHITSVNRQLLELEQKYAVFVKQKVRVPKI